MIDIDVHSNYNIFLHNSSIYLLFLLQGEYRLVVDKVYPCGSRTNHTIQFNIYSSKKTSSKTEAKGNITILTPFDDNVTVSIYNA